MTEKPKTEAKRKKPVGKLSDGQNEKIISGETETIRLGRLIGLCRRAGRLRTGVDAVADAVRMGAVALVLVASDAAENSRKRITNCCRFYETPLSPCQLTRFEMAHYSGTGGEVSAVGITDAGLAASVVKLLSEKNRPATAETPAEKDSVQEKTVSGNKQPNHRTKHKA